MALERYADSVTWIPVAGVAPPLDRLELDDLALVTEITHPLRSRIVRRLKQPRTVAEVADDLDVPVTRLYHHVNRLERAGLIRVVATRQVAAVTERRYQVTAKSFGIDEALIEAEDPADVAIAIGSLFDLAKIGLQREIENGSLSLADHDAVLSLGEIVLSPARHRELMARLTDVMTEFVSDTTEDDPSARRVTLFVSAVDHTT